MSQQDEDQAVFDSMRHTTGLFLAAGFKRLPAAVSEPAMGRISTGKLYVAVVMEFTDTIRGTCRIYDPSDGKAAYSFSVEGGTRIVFDEPEKSN